jgi:hypothetical protein
MVFNTSEDTKMWKPITSTEPLLDVDVIVAWPHGRSIGAGYRTKDVHYPEVPSYWVINDAFCDGDDPCWYMEIPEFPK